MTPLERRADWWPRLKATVAEWEGRPFEWGRTDCACFAAACVEAVTGVDVLDGRRGTYASRLQARARLRWWRHPSVASAAGDALEGLGCVPVPPMFASVGDVGVTGDDVLAVRMPAGFIARGPDGSFGRVKVEKAWAVAWPK